MNNAFNFEETPVQKVDTSEEQARLTRILEALRGLIETQEWNTLCELHFEKEEDRVTRLILSESKKNPLEIERIYQLQGELIWAKRYADLRKWITSLTSQLKQLQNGK